MSDQVEFVIPEYLTKDILQKSLRKGLNEDKIEVVNFDVSAGSRPGDNYTSVIYRVKVIYDNAHSKENVIYLIIKSLLSVGASAVLSDLGFIDKEINVYLEVLPKLQKILGTTTVAPKCYDIFMEPHRNIVFQDLKADGFICADREIGLDEEHLAVALKKIAKFHAASIKLLKKEPSIESDYQTGFFTEESVKSPIFDAVFTNNIKLGAEIASRMPGYERFREKLLKVYDNFNDIALKSVEHDPSVDFTVLNHGDLWVNNFLFKYDEESKKPVDVVFVDYQGTYFNSLGLDLNYLFITSARLEVLHRKIEFIENYYYPTLVAEMKTLGLDSIPSFSTILKQIANREMFTLICLFGVLPLVSMDKEESKTNSFSQFSDEEMSTKKTLVGMSSKRFSGSMKYTLDYLEKILDETLKNY